MIVHRVLLLTLTPFSLRFRRARLSPCPACGSAARTLKAWVGLSCENKTVRCLIVRSPRGAAHDFESADLRCIIDCPGSHLRLYQTENFPNRAVHNY